LNLVSYFDAARAVLKVLESGAESDGQIYVIADGKVTTSLPNGVHDSTAHDLVSNAVLVRT